MPNLAWFSAHWGWVLQLVATDVGQQRRLPQSQIAAIALHWELGTHADLNEALDAGFGPPALPHFTNISIFLDAGAPAYSVTNPDLASFSPAESPFLSYLAQEE
eukprot:4972574-Amphidinium_carterae.1